MKALPLWQPWASLVAIEAKRIETRHWAAPHRLIGQRIAIHATKTTSARRSWIAADADRLPCHRRRGEQALRKRVLIARDPDEHAFGHYEPGRFAWVLRDIGAPEGLR